MRILQSNHRSFEAGCTTTSAMKAVAILLLVAFVAYAQAQPSVGCNDKSKVGSSCGVDLGCHRFD